MTDADDAAEAALLLPSAVQSGTGFQVNGKGFAWFYNEKVPGQKGRVEHRDVLAIRVTNEDEKQALIASDPGKFFTDAHYSGFPTVLVRLPAIEIDELTELLIDAWRIQAPRRMLKAFDTSGAE